MVYPRFSVKSVGIGYGRKLHQVVVPFVVFRKEDEMVVPVSLVPGGVPLGIHVDLAADDWLDACGQAFIVKFHGAVHGAVVGHGDGGHSVLHGPGGELVAPYGPVEEAVFSMDVKMNKLSGHC